MTTPEDLIEAIRSFPVRREVEHCGARIEVEPFDFYAECPQCSARIKVRSFSALSELEDVFDAVFEWLNRREAAKVAKRRQDVLAGDE